MLKVSFLSNYTEVRLMSLNVIQPNEFQEGTFALDFGLLKLVNHDHFIGLSDFSNQGFFHYPKGPSSTGGYYCSTLCFHPQRVVHDKVTDLCNSTGSVWPHFHGRYSHHVHIYRKGTSEKPCVEATVVSSKIQALGHHQGLPILVHRYLGMGWYCH